AMTGLFDPMAHDKRPTFRPPRGIPARYAVPIDFTLVRPATLPNFRATARLCFEEKVPVPGGRRLVYVSDHIGIELEVTWGEEHYPHPLPPSPQVEFRHRHFRAWASFRLTPNPSPQRGEGLGVRSIRPAAPRLLLVSECEASREGESDGQVASQEARCSGAGCACWRAIRTV